jgi:hypothetical protein
VTSSGVARFVILTIIIKASTKSEDDQKQTTTIGMESNRAICPLGGKIEDEGHEERRQVSIG